MPFDIHRAVQILREVTADFPKAEMFALRDAGYDAVFEQLVGCILSIRTRDETSGPAALRLFSRARHPSALIDLGAEEIERLIYPVAFSKGKAVQIVEIARVAVDQYGGELPAEFGVLTSLNGVGPKCANLTLGVARGIPAIAVDVHVHRITNRWGYIEAKTPEATMVSLEGKLPREYWVEINELLVPFGKKICPGLRPKCATCPLTTMCARVGVAEASTSTKP